MKQFFRKKTVLIAAAVVLTLASVLSFVRKSNETYAASSRSRIASTVDDIHDVFPESYWAGLEALKSMHPNWRFVAFYTTLDFDRCLKDDAEMYPTTNLVHYGRQVYGLDYLITTSWYSTEVPGSFNWAENTWKGWDSGQWYQASKEAVSYCMDPRNFFDETQIFQFFDGSIPFSDSIASENVVSSIINRVIGNNQDSHWAKSGEELGLYYEVEEPNPEYAAYLEHQAEIQESIEASIEASIEESLAAESSSTEESSAEESSDVSEPSESVPDESEIPMETEPAPPETIIVKHYLTYSQALQKIADELGLNAAMITSRIMQEQGNGDSDLISGTRSFTTKDGATISGGYYNYFNMGAYGSGMEEIINNGLREAYEGGWNTRYKALYGGAAKYKNEYISKGQSTFYLQKFNVIVPEPPQQSRLFWGQYMQNLTAPQTECKMLKNSLERANVLDADYTFLIPVYEKMPSSNPRPTKDGNPNYKLGGIQLNELPVPGFSLDKTSYGPFSVEDRIVRIYVTSCAPTTTVSVTLSHDGNTGPLNVQKTTSLDTNGIERGMHTAEVYLDDGDTTLTFYTTAKNGDQGTYAVTVHYETPPETEPESSESESGSETESTEESGSDANPTESSSESESSGSETEASSSTPEETVPTEPSINYGDVNDDQAYDIFDVAEMRSHILGYKVLGLRQFLAADLDGDGEITVFDVAVIRSFILGYIDKIEVIR